MHFNIISCPSLGFQMAPIFQVSPPKPYMHSPCPYTCYIHRPSPTPLLYHTNNPWRFATDHENPHYAIFSNFLLLPDSYIFLSKLFSKTLSLRFSLDATPGSKCIEISYKVLRIPSSAFASKYVSCDANYWCRQKRIKA
jgi:hypothetical protein